MRRNQKTKNLRSTGISQETVESVLRKDKRVCRVGMTCGKDRLLAGSERDREL